MWDGLIQPIACKEHRHVDESFDDVKVQKETKKETKKRKRGRKSLLAASGAGSIKVGGRTSAGANVIQIESSDEEESPRGATVQDGIRRWNTPNSFDPRVASTRTVNTSDRYEQVTRRPIALSFRVD
jgi:hypothetical protein